MVSDGCPTREELLAYSLGRVSSERQAALSRHLDNCAACLSVLEELEGEADALLAAVSRASLQPSSEELLGDQDAYHQGLTQTLALVGSWAGAEHAAFGGDDGFEETPRSRLGQYELLEELGRGGMGIVYRARHASLDKEVALKILYGARIGSEEAVERFQREMKAVGKLEHPSIVQATDAGQIDGAYYLAMEFVRGRNLSQLLRDEGALPAGRSAEVIRDAARGLQHAHQRGLVHRDIKPSNILLDGRGRARITDFGLVLTESDPTDDLAYAGTPAYMSPEQARGRGHTVDGRSDIFSLGAVFYRLLTGRLPFEASNAKQMCERISSIDPLPPRSIVPGVPAELERICLKALAKCVPDRYATASELADELDVWLQRSRGRERVAPPHRGEYVEIVPRGLAPYDREDAEFYPRLVPGADVRGGLPGAVQFWKRRIEELDVRKSFSVGVLRGPTGCGKTSLIRAGVLPNLDEHVTTIYLVATGSHTEAALAAKLRDRFPSIPEDVELVRMLTEAERILADRHDSKLLIVFDQFEQWLHNNRVEETQSLVRAMRLFDGRRLQGLLIVRDDLWTSTARFVEACGVDLTEGAHSAALELLSAEHARSTLAALGRAYGALPNQAGDQTAEQIRFLDDATAELAEGGFVNPSRLTTFAETVKDVGWTPARLRRMGGVRGAGVAFLQAKFGAFSNRGKYRRHREAAQGVLAELCPEDGQCVRNAARDRQRLVSAAGYRKTPEKFDELFSILCHRLKLVTLVDPQEIPAERGAEIEKGDCRFYRLSHEYAASIVRDWLRSDWAGIPPRRARWRAIWGRLFPAIGLFAGLFD